MNIDDLGETGLIERLKKVIACEDPRVIVPVGDDAAAVQWDDDRVLLLSCDVLVEDVHFRLNRDLNFALLGRRAMGAALSDIAAMAGEPRFGLVSLGLDDRLKSEDVEALIQGTHEMAIRHGAKVVGGNTASSRRKVFCDVFVIGETRRSNLLTRAGAKAGDRILLTGALGRSAALLGKGRMAPVEPRIAEARWLSQVARISAMIDISDGLSTDLHHLARSSRVGARILVDKIPVSPEARSLSSASEAQELALHGGEDFELLFAAAPEESRNIAREAPKNLNVRITEIGEVVPEIQGVKLVDQKGQEQPFAPAGWDHFRTGRRRSPTTRSNRRKKKRRT